MHPNPRKFAVVGGIIMLVMGVTALIFEGSRDLLPKLTLESSYGEFLGIFPMNLLNKVALIVFGLWGIVAARTAFSDLRASIFYCKAVSVVMGLLTVLGLFETTNTLGGYWPLFGGEIFAHALFAAVGAYFGFSNKLNAVVERRREEKAA
jgi:hypothetical protein